MDLNRSLKVLQFFDGVAYPFVLGLDGFALGRFHGDMQGSFNMSGVFAFLDTGVASITKDSLFFLIHQLVCWVVSCSLAEAVSTL